MNVQNQTFSRGIALLTLLLVFVTTDLMAQLTLERVWFSGEFRQERMSSVEWFKDGSQYLSLKQTETGTDYVLTNVKSGETTILVDGGVFTTPDGEKLNVEDHTFSDDFSKMLLYGNSKRVWRSNTKGDYWLYDLTTHRVKQLGKGLPASSLMFAKLSPDHSSVAYVSEFNIYLEDLKTGKITPLTEDGTEDIINGTFDWVYEEEFTCRDGFRWSEDGKSIAFWQLDASNIRDFYMINNTDSLYPFMVPVQYPKVGEDPSRCRVAVVNVASGERTWMDIKGDQIQHYLPRMQWVKGQLLVQQLDRKQQEQTFWMCNPTTGEAKQVYNESDEAYIEIMNNDFSAGHQMDEMPYLSKSNELLHLTEKDGWRHLYAIKANGSGERLVTDFEGDISAVYSTQIDKGIAYICASPDNATQRYLYQASLTKSGAVKRLTPSNYSGVNNYSVSPNGKYAIHYHQNTNEPRTVRLIQLPSHKTIRTLVENKEYKHLMDSLNYPTAEFSKITTASGIEMDVRMLKPSNFDPTKKYPVLFYVYGEPWGQTCSDTWSFGYDNVIAELGYIVVTIDNRGTPCPKGREWRKCIYRKVGRLNISDQAEAAQEIAKLPFIDDQRVAVWGWSGGGSSTLNLMFQYPDVYSCGISVAPVANQLYYDNIYQERYMGLPQENREDFVAGSPVTYANGLEGDLLIVHGTGDDNVHYQGTEELINALVKFGKQFQVMPYPNRSHGIWEGEGTTKHLYTLMTNFLTDHVEAGPK